ncbi:MAG: biotin/lipoyl-binding protein, partial [Bryobacterales bacterium]|nr:biotin/lipoyl-binding protein [Bryobacterales bacterium]
MVSQRDVPINVDVIGNVEAYSTITVKAQVGGELTKVSFHEGDSVKKGDLLFTIDGRPFEAQLSQAQANLARDTATLSQAEANLARDIANEKYAQDQSVRYRQLLDQGVVSREQGDQMRSSADALSQTVLADKAAIESARAQIVASKAAVETATVQMSYTTIRSPIDGRTGSIAVKQGNVVAANTSDLMTITQVQPIYVTFSVPEAQLSEIKRYMGQGQLPVHAAPQGDLTNQEAGVLTFIDNSVDSTTGT